MAEIISTAKKKRSKIKKKKKKKKTGVIISRKSQKDRQYNGQTKTVQTMVYNTVHIISLFTYIICHVNLFSS